MQRSSRRGWDGAEGGGGEIKAARLCAVTQHRQQGHIGFSTNKAVKVVVDSLRCCRLHTFHLEVLFTKGISPGAGVAINLKPENKKKYI